MFAAIATAGIALAVGGYLLVGVIAPSDPASQAGGLPANSRLPVGAEVQANAGATIPSSPAPASPSPTPPSSTHSTAPAGPPSGPVSSPISSVPAGNVSCDYRDDTWSSDAGSVGYSVNETQAANGYLASWTAVLNANPGTTEVVGYPDDQCILYSALPSGLTSSFAITPPADSSGLDYEYAYDIWLTTAQAASNSDWNNDMELMIWTYVNGQRPAGSAVSTLSDGSAVWSTGNNSTGTVSVVLPKNEVIGTIDIASIISQLEARGYITTADDGILDVEYGIEAPYGGGQTFEVNAFSVTT
jgi:Glycosyl hydrolase family 12